MALPTEYIGIESYTSQSNIPDLLLSCKGSFILIYSPHNLFTTKRCFVQSYPDHEIP